jgi:hypothetical protein
VAPPFSCHSGRQGAIQPIDLGANYQRPGYYMAEWLRESFRVCGRLGCQVSRLQGMRFSRATRPRCKYFTGTLCVGCSRLHLQKRCWNTFWLSIVLLPSPTFLLLRRSGRTTTLVPRCVWFIQGLNGFLSAFTPYLQIIMAAVSCRPHLTVR